MYSEPPVKIPYLDWALDRWKIGVILALFVGLALASLVSPPSTESVKLPTETVLPATAAQTEEETEPSAQPARDAPSTEDDGSKALLVPGISRPADMIRLPLTLAGFGPNAVVPPGAVRVLHGSAAAGSSVKVHDQVVSLSSNSDLSPGSSEDHVLGLATTGNEGLWQLALAEPLVTGQHILTLQELGPQDELTAVSEPVVITVLARGEQGPLALATPIIRSPALGVRLPPGVVEFTGTGLPGVVVRLHLNNSFVAESLVTTQDNWRIVPEQPLSPGVYTARVTAINPQGDVLAESAPVIFVVQEEPTQSSLPLTLPAPTLPLTISSLAFEDRRRTNLVVNGFATPHAAVTAWMEGRLLKVANVALDGAWMLYLENLVGFEENISLEVRSNFGERVRTDAQRQRPVLVELPDRPRLLSPKAGQLLLNRRPLLVGLAQPESEVVILVNRQMVAQVRADQEGQWSIRLADPLPTGAVALGVACTTDEMPGEQATPVVVMVVVNYKVLVARSPQSLAQMPPKRLYYPVPTGP